MRTGRSLTVCRSLLPGGGGGVGSAPRWGVDLLLGGWGLPLGASAPGGVVSAPGMVSAPGGCLLPGVSAPNGVVSAPGGVCSWGGWCLLRGVVSAPRGVSAPGGVVFIPACTETDTPPVDRHTLVKILPWPNFVAAGNNSNQFNTFYDL